MKKCTKCLERKDLDKFSKNKSQNDGYNNICKCCKKIFNQIYHEKIKEYREKNKEKNNEKSKEWKIKNPKRVKELYLINNSKKTKEEIKLNNQKQKEYKRNWNKTQYKLNPNYKLSQLFRIRLIIALKNSKRNKIESSLKLLGCSINQFKIHISSLFLPEMTWENHGSVWEIDHIKPCAYFDLTDENHQKLCFHYTNMQPLFKTSGIAKSFGYIEYIGNRNKKNKEYVPSYNVYKG